MALCQVLYPHWNRLFWPFVLDGFPGLRTPHLQSSAARLNHLLCEVMAVAMPPVAYSFVTKSRPALHTFARAGREAGTRGETKS